MRLLLLRHGQTVANTTAALDTAAPGHELTELGRRQAHAAGQALGTVGIGLVAVSTATRTSQTALPLVRSLGLEPVRHDGLREIAAGDFEMRSDQEALEGFLGTVGAWLEGDLHRRMPGGETGAEFLDRYDAAIAAGLRPRGRRDPRRQPRSRHPDVGHPSRERRPRAHPRGTAQHGLHHPRRESRRGVDHHVVAPRAHRRRVARRRGRPGPDRGRPRRRRGAGGLSSVLGVVAQVGREPALRLGQAPALALGVVGDLVAPEAADHEVLRLRVREVPARRRTPRATSPSTR